MARYKSALSAYFTKNTYIHTYTYIHCAILPDLNYLIYLLLEWRSPRPRRKMVVPSDDHCAVSAEVAIYNQQLAFTCSGFKTRFSFYSVCPSFCTSCPQSARNMSIHMYVVWRKIYWFIWFSFNRTIISESGYYSSLGRVRPEGLRR